MYIGVSIVVNKQDDEGGVRVELECEVDLSWMKARWMIGVRNMLLEWEPGDVLNKI